MDARTAEIIAKIQNDIGVDDVVIRPVAGSWAILHPTDLYHAEELYRAKTEEECHEILRMCR